MSNDWFWLTVQVYCSNTKALANSSLDDDWGNSVGFMKFMKLSSCLSMEQGKLEIDTTGKPSRHGLM